MTFISYIVLSGRKILEKKNHNGSIAFVVVTQIVLTIDGSFYRLIKSSIL